MNKDERAKYAQMLQGNPLWQEILSSARDVTYKGWLSNRDAAEREKLWYMAQALSILEADIEMAIKEAQIGEQDSD